MAGVYGRERVPNRYEFAYLRRRGADGQGGMAGPRHAERAVCPDHTAVARAVTARKREILELVAAGLTTKAISAQTGLSVGGVDKHLRALMARYTVPNRAALVGAAFRARDLR